MIEQLINDSADAAGMDRDQAWAALTGALGLLEKHAAREPMAALYEAVPGAEALATAPQATPAGGGGLFGGLMRGAGGLSGAAVADAMGLMARLKAAGIDRDDLKRLVPAARERVRAETGRDLLGEAVDSVPGVGKLLAGG